MRKARIDEALSRFLSSIAQYVVLAAALITALGKVGVETTSLVALLASAGLAVGLALQGSLSNFAAGVMILFFRPFALGDRIQAAGQNGTVQDIGIFVTTLLSPNLERIIVPNSAIIGGCITNYSSEGRLRAEIKLTVPYGCDLDDVQAVVLEAVKHAEYVLADPAPTILFANLAESGLELIVAPYAKAPHYANMVNNAKRAVYEAVGKARFRTPFKPPAS